jgi:hypothetical protein
MVGQNHRRNPLAAVEFIPPGSLHAAMVELRSTILSPYDSVAHRSRSESQLGSLRGAGHHAFLFPLLEIGVERAVNPDAVVCEDVYLGLSSSRTVPRLKTPDPLKDSGRVEDPRAEFSRQ